MRERTISGLLLLTTLLLGASLPLQAQSWPFTGSLQQARSYFTATLLSNGSVLVVGGTYRGTFVQYGLTSAELYNPATGTFSKTGSLNTGRFGHSATLLKNGKVLIAGGTELHTPHLLSSGKVLIVAGNHFGSIASAELYDPASGSFSNTTSLNTPRQAFASALLPNGQVLAIGGYNSKLGKFGWLASAELYH